MARQFTAASTHYISAASIPGNVGNNARSVAFFVRTTNYTTRQFCYIEGDESAAYSRFSLEIESSKFSLNVRSASIYASTTPANDTWFHFCATYNGSGAAEVYIDGVDVGGTTGLTLTTAGSGFNLGRYYGGSIYLNGQLAEVCKYNVALSPGAVAILAKGLVPSKLQRADLAFYAPLVRNVQDMKGLALTDNGPTTASDHPRTYR